MNNPALILLSLTCLLTGTQVLAADGRSDYDLDDDGLIEINDLADLNEIRNNLDGTSLYGNSTGCPAGGCNGFELTADLDFDTNGDGQMNELDDWWNNGEGWQPIGGSYSTPFITTFDGRGHQIRNLWINRPDSNYSGLFGFVRGAHLQQLALTGSLTQVVGKGYAGLLSGYADQGSVISGVYATGSVQVAGDNAGGIVGHLQDSTVQYGVSAASVAGGNYIGGIVGRATTSQGIGKLNQVLAVGSVTSDSSYRGGIAGGLSGVNINATYWATDATGQDAIGPLLGTVNTDSSSGHLLAELQCPTAADNSSCVTDTTLYAGWGDAVYIDAEGNTQSYWNFGTDSQLPALNLNGTLYRDSDGDGAVDSDDLWPDNRAAAYDRDADGYPDRWASNCDAQCRVTFGLALDKFPDNAAAWQDDDNDGQPESWDSSCDSSCQQASGLLYDLYPDDFDNDGLTTAQDPDDNNDGIEDADADSDGLIDVSTLAELNAIRYSLNGQGQRLTDSADIDSSGCPEQIVNGLPQPRCRGYELTADLDFDTNGDGQMNELDNWWNNGEGWLPIGNGSNPFIATFDGRGHQIRNLWINRSGSSYSGLFGFVRGAHLQQLALTGSLTQVVGKGYTGLLSGYADQGSVISGVYATGSVQVAGDNAGGIVGDLHNSTVQYGVSAASVAGGNYIGDLVGWVSGWKDISKLNQVLAMGSVTSDGFYRGSIAGWLSGSNVNATYWATDATGQDAIGYLSGTVNTDSSSGYLLAELQCPTAADNSSCVTDTTLYAGWGDAVYIDAEGNTQSYWNFGTDSQLPALNLNGTLYRDSDGDGAVDSDDLWPDNRAAAYDRDADGYPDRWSANCDAQCRVTSGLALDKFPDNAAAWQDDDNDGQPESWDSNCDSSCQQASGLLFDLYPDDFDNDGLTTAQDPDDNNDGIEDADADSDGLIDVSTLTELNAIRYSLNGQGQRLSDSADIDSSGCPEQIVNGLPQPRCRGYELTADLDFDTNGDGQMNELDNWWNNGQGWQPIGSYSNPFIATFDGRGHQIRNLWINRPGSNYSGLFASVREARLQQLALTGPLTQVVGNGYAGLLSGYADQGSVISGVYATGSVQVADGYAGGIVGDLYNSTVQYGLSAASVAGGNYIGGLVGRARSWKDVNQFNQVLVMGSVTSDGSYRGGIAGWLSGSNVNATYWATDATGQDAIGSLIGMVNTDNSSGHLLAELQCPTAANNGSCVADLTLYAGWGDAVYIDAEGNTQSYWNFGTDSQLPALNLNGTLYRDSDGDGVIDHEDAFPEDPTETSDFDQDGTGDNADIDDDGDGFDDTRDQFPFDGSEWSDRDGDGVGDNADRYPDDALDWADRDGDGIGDNADLYPDDGSDWADRDGDGVGDNADRYPDDMDNDAIPDEFDPDNAVDNGRPVMMPFDSDLSLAVSDDAGLFAELSETQFLEWKASAYAEDAVDASALLTYRVYLQGNELIADEDEIVRLPVGLHRVEWFASDLAGNMSEPIPQLIRIYPRARFAQAESLMGENAVADVWLSLSGPSPEYPVQFKLSIDQQLSTAEQSDVDAAFSLDAEHLVTLLPGADNTPATRAAFQLPIAVDSVFEQREILLINLEQSMVVSAEGRELNIDPQWQQHSLLITDENLPPEISLSVKQAGAETDVIDRAAGDVSVEIRIVDPNGNDGHQIALNFGGLVAVAPNTRQVTFSPLGLTSGVYRVWINVTDDGVPALSSVLEKAIEVVDVEASTESADGNDQNEEEKESSSGSSGGGSLIWLLTLSPVLLATRRRRLAKAA